MSFIIETSARHVHLDRAAMDVLFGEGAELTNKKDLSQPGQYARSASRSWGRSGSVRT